MTALRLLASVAHPDDETLGLGGTLARYAAEGVETYLITATRGERGWFGDEASNPGLTKLGQVREGELKAATDVLGLRETELLDYIDGDLDQAPVDRVTRQIANAIRRIRPHIVVTFGHGGVYGHPDHIAMTQFTTSAVILAASSDADLEGEPYLVSKLYYLGPSKAHLAAYEAAFGELVMNVDGQERRSLGWEEWEQTTRVDTSAYWQQVWRAVVCHRTQLPTYAKLAELPEDYHADLWGSQDFYRVFSTVNSGRQVETDLFEGLR